MHKFELVDNRRLTPSVALLTMESRSSRSFHFVPGQYAAVHFKKHGRRSAARCFSIVSSPDQARQLQFAVRLTGRYTAQLAQLKPGDRLYVQGGFGDFTINHDYDRQLVLLAGGIGITPFISMLRQLQQSGQQLPISLYYACRDASDMPFAEELRDLAQRIRRLDVNFVSRQPLPAENLQPANVVRGRIDEELLGKAVYQAGSGTTFFVCGPPSFMASVSDALAKLGVPEDRIITEAFGARPPLGMPGERWPKLIYGTTFASIILGVALLSAGSLLRSAQARAASLYQSLQSSNQGAADPASSMPASTGGTTPAPSNQSYYQPPMSSVS